jgi:hypothetical protein
MKAIETRYAGCRFRSRLEARWAVFFDALGVTWEYEPQGFETSVGPYLPDFRITMPTDWVPYYFEVKPDNAPVDARHHALALEGGYPVIVARGIPRDYGDQMGGQRRESPLEALLGGDRGDPSGWVSRHPCAFVGPIGRGRADPRDMWDSIQKGRYWDQEAPECAHIALYPGPSGPFAPYISLEVDQAYTAARSARFEHGESPVLTPATRRPWWSR